MTPSDSTRSPLGLDIMLHSYSITINVSPNKILKNRRKYGDLSLEEQKEVILIVFLQAIQLEGIDSYDYEFEQTMLGHAHLHGLIEATEEQVLSVQMYVHSVLGFPKVHQSICCTVEKTIVDSRYWVDYMRKDIMRHNITTSTWYQQNNK